MNRRGSFDFGGFIGNLGLFIGLSLLIAAPCVILSLNGLVSNAMSSSGSHIANFFGGLFSTIFHGVWLSFATVGYAFMHFSDLGLGNIIFAVLYFIVASFIIYEFLRMIFHFVDGVKNKPTSKILLFVLAMIIMIILSAVLFIVTGGETILSNTVNNDSVVVQNNVSNYTPEYISQNITNNSISINMSS